MIVLPCWCTFDPCMHTHTHTSSGKSFSTVIQPCAVYPYTPALITTSSYSTIRQRLAIANYCINSVLPRMKWSWVLTFQLDPRFLSNSSHCWRNVISCLYQTSKFPHQPGYVPVCVWQKLPFSSARPSLALWKQESVGILQSPTGPQWRLYSLSFTPVPRNPSGLVVPCRNISLLAKHYSWCLLKYLHYVVLT